MGLDKFNQELFEKNHVFLKRHIKARQSRKLLNKALTDMNNLIPRRMINSVQRLISLADDIEQVRPGKKDLSIFFLVTSIESVYTLSSSPFNNKQGLLIDFFSNYLVQEEQEYLFNRIKILSDGERQMYVSPISAENFALMLTGIRNQVAHEGNYWSFNFKKKENSSDIMCLFSSKLKKDEGSREITYQIGITYEILKDFCIKGLVRYIENYYEEVESSSQNLISWRIFLVHIRIISWVLRTTVVVLFFMPKLLIIPL